MTDTDTITLAPALAGLMTAREYATRYDDGVLA